MTAPRREIKNRFKNLLRTYVDAKGNNLYHRLIQDMCSANKSSFEVSLSSFQSRIGIGLQNAYRPCSINIFLENKFFGHIRLASSALKFSFK